MTSNDIKLVIRLFDEDVNEIESPEEQFIFIDGSMSFKSIAQQVELKYSNTILFMMINDFKIHLVPFCPLEYVFSDEDVLEAKVVLKQKAKFLSPQDSLCKVHSQVISTYCYTCDELLCFKCFYSNTNHNKHEEELVDLTKFTYVKEINDKFYRNKPLNDLQTQMQTILLGVSEVIKRDRIKSQPEVTLLLNEVILFLENELAVIKGEDNKNLF